MRIGIFGSGYVGLVTGTCFAEMGNHVICVDVNPDRIAKLQQGISPIYEPGLQAMMERNVSNGTMEFTLNAMQAIAQAQILFIAVGTPPEEDGSADLQYVLQVAQTIGEHMTEYRVVVNKSTVPVGTADKVKQAIQAAQKKRGVSIPFDVVSNPEFLKEGSAVNDCMRPDRIVVGSESEQATHMMKALYGPFNRNHDKLIVMDVRSSEMTKYAANAMLATKISFMNEMSRIAERVGANIEKVRVGIGSDQRIGYSFIYPGCGYGGSCFPKDVQALDHTAEEFNYQASILKAVHSVNEKQKEVLLEKIFSHYHNQIKGKVFALWGLSFKPNTDDIREAPSRVVMEGIWAAGGSIRAYDPEAMPAIAQAYGERADLTLCKTRDEALHGSNALIVVTEWMPFRSPDPSLFTSLLKDRVIFDGRNLYDPDYLKQQGVSYYSIGRPPALAQ